MVVQDSLESLPDGLGYFPESVGFIPRRLLDGGVICRSIPKGMKNDTLFVAPLFSLLGGTGDYEPLLLTILKRNGSEPLQFIQDALCAPFAKLWLEMAMRFGLLIEAHAQDLMIGLSRDLKPIGQFYYRDFEGIQVDWELRRFYGLSVPDNMPRACSWFETYCTLGYSGAQQVWWKWFLSLQNYTEFVLDKINISLIAWQERGLLSGSRAGRDDVTMLFSRNMWGCMEEMFDIRVKDKYNIHRRFVKFLIFLAERRKEVMSPKGQ
jgi:hypothetical protein